MQNESRHQREVDILVFEICLGEKNVGIAKTYLYFTLVQNVILI